MRMRISALFAIIAILLLGVCNNHFHELIPPDEDRILSFTVPGQTRKEIINDHTITIFVEKGVDITSLLPSVSVSPKARFIPITLDYIQATFPDVDIPAETMALYRSDDISNYVLELIRANKETFSVPAIDMPIDFGGPVDFLVVAAMGNIRRYTVNVAIDSGEPLLLGIRFSKYDNPELIADALCQKNENSRTVNAIAIYPVEMDDLSFALVPSFEILGDSMEVDGGKIRSGVDAIQFEKILSIPQTKILALKRGDETKDYALTVIFVEDPDTVRSITDFRFTVDDNPGIAANAVASIINTDGTGTITVQVFYSGTKPSMLTARFITPGTVSVGGIPQTNGISTRDFSSPLEYRVVSRNGMYMRIYTVRVEMLSLANDAPRITSFRFIQNLNHDLVQDTVAVISDGLIMIDVYYGSLLAPETLTPEFLAGGMVTVSGSVQVSGASAQDFSRQIKYTVAHPEIPQLKRDYWVQARLTRDTSSDAKINTFGFYTEENPWLADGITGKIDQVNGKIIIYAPSGSGATSREMIPRFTAVGKVNADGYVQTSGVSSRIFNAPVTYTVTSANGKNSKTYTVELRELRSTIFVDHRAHGNNDGINWQDAFISLQLACEAAALFPEDVPKEIWIAAGTYKPGLATENYFLLSANTSYIGGFAGTETAKSQRNVTANKVIVSGDLGGGRYSNNLFGAFNGNNTITINGDLSFEDLIFNDAKAVMSGNRSNGAAINAVLSAEAEFNISRCSINGFTANGNGGAVYVSGGNVWIVDTSIENAGGIYHSGGILSIDKLTLKNISGIGINKINGGGVTLSGINADSISGSAVNCTVISSGQVSIGGNSKFNNTGRVYVSSSVAVQVTNTEIRNNSGDSALYVDSGSRPTTIERVTVDGVPDGRGICVYSTNSVQISESQIRNCRTTSTIYNYGHGGGIFLGGSGNHNISGVTIENCTAYQGGGICLNGSGNKEISGVTIENVEARDGGAVSSTSTSSLIINNSSITNARSLSDGTANIFNSGGGSLTVDGLTLRDITGRGIMQFLCGGDVSLSRIDASGISDSAVTCAGTTIGSVTLKNSKFNNTGNVWVTDGTLLQVTDTEFRNMQSNALSISGSIAVTIDNITIDGANSTYGGGIWITTSNSVLINGSTIRNCTAVNDGGGIYHGTTGNKVISNVTIENCRAGGRGGAVYPTSGFTRINTQFINCSP